MGGAESKFAQIYKKHDLDGVFYILLKALERHYVKQTLSSFTKVNDKVKKIECNDVQSIISQSQMYRVEKLQEIQQIMNESYKEKKNNIQNQFRQEIKKYLPDTKNQPCQRFKGIREDGLKFLYEYDSAPEDTKKQIEEECKKSNRYKVQYDQLQRTAPENIIKLNRFLDNSNFENRFKNMQKDAKDQQESRENKRVKAAQGLSSPLKSKS